MAHLALKHNHCFEAFLIPGTPPAFSSNQFCVETQDSPLVCESPQRWFCVFLLQIVNVVDVLILFKRVQNDFKCPLDEVQFLQNIYWWRIIIAGSCNNVCIYVPIGAYPDLERLFCWPNICKAFVCIFVVNLCQQPPNITNKAEVLWTSASVIFIITSVIYFGNHLSKVIFLDFCRTFC